MPLRRGTQKKNPGDFYTLKIYPGASVAVPLQSGPATLYVSIHFAGIHLFLLFKMSAIAGSCCVSRCPLTLAVFTGLCALC